MKKKRKHRFVLTVTFDRPCSASYAVAEVRNNVHGEHYTNGVHEDGEPEEFRIKSVRHMPHARD